MSWRESVPLGRTRLSPAEVHAVVQQMGLQYKGNRCGAAPAARWPPAAAAAGVATSANRRCCYSGCSGSLCRGAPRPSSLTPLPPTT